MKIKSKSWLRGLLALCLLTPVAQADLGSVLRQIDTNAPNLAAANSRAAAASANVRATRSRYFGTASVFGNRIEYSDPVLVAPISPPVDFQNFTFDDSHLGVGLALSLPLDINRRIAALVGEQRRLSEAAVLDAERVRLFLFGRAVQLYRTLQELQGNHDALVSQLQALEKNYQVVETKIDVGRAARVELLRIDAERKAVDGQLAALDGQEIGLRSALAALLGQADYGEALTVITSAPHALSVQDVSDTLQRPDVQAAERRVAAAQKKLDGAHRDWLPGMQLQVNTLRNKGLSTSHQDTWSVMLRLNWELWDGGRRAAVTDSARAGLSAFSSDLSAARYAADQELNAAVAAWRAARLQYQSAVAGLAAATETERIQSDRFQAGRISAADLIDAEAALATAMASKTGALARWWLADDLAHLAVGLVPTAYSATVAGE